LLFNIQQLLLLARSYAVICFTISLYIAFSI